MFRTIKPIMLQTGLIEPQVFGVNRRPVLRAIYSTADYIEFSPTYLPVAGTELNDIDFQLNDINNNIHEFLPGSVQLRLHFQKCNRGSQGYIKEQHKSSHYQRRQ